MADEFTKAALYWIKTFNKKVKEKIWIEKLVMLLDIYEEEVVGVHSVWEHITEKDEAWIISKKYWFIKWLVDNDKIDIKKAKEGEIMLSRNDEENIIWKLSISDTPIDLLCSLLKL